jgi:hypothetical protein
MEVNMHKRTAGIILLCISAFLYGIRYVSAAIFGSNVSSWDSQLFDAMLDYVGKGPLVLSVLALIAGIVYLIIAELESSIAQHIKKIKENWNDFDNEKGKEKE